MSAEHFYRNYSTALLTWQSVETALLSVLVTMLEEPNLKRIAAMYYSQDAFGAKLRIVDAVAKVTFTKSKVKDDWKALKKRMNAAYEERNVLAHFTAVSDTRGSAHPDDMKLTLDAAGFVPSEMRRVRKRKYNADGCYALFLEFFALAQDINAFAKRADWV